MFLACNAIANDGKKLGMALKQRDDKIKNKLATSRAKWSKDTSYTESGSIRSSGSESLSLTKTKCSLKAGSLREESSDVERVTREMREKAVTIALIESQFEKYYNDIDVASKRYDSCKQIILARMESRSAVGIILAINEYKKLLAKEATARRVVEQLESLLVEVVDCIELPGTIAQYKMRVMDVLNEAPIDAEALPLTGVTSQVVSAELTKLGIARN